MSVKEDNEARVLRAKAMRNIAPEVIHALYISEDIRARDEKIPRKSPVWPKKVVKKVSAKDTWGDWAEDEEWGAEGS